MAEISIEQRLKDKGIVLPDTVETGEEACAVVNNLLYVSNQVCYGPGGIVPDIYRGQLGNEISVDIGREATRLCVLNILALAQRKLGSLDAISRCIQLNGIIAATRRYTAFRTVMDGASETAGMLLGTAGEHDRTTIGTEHLPQNACASVGAIFVLKSGGIRLSSAA